MNLTEVQDEMAERLDQIDGLRVPDRGNKPTPPAALFLLPEEIRFDDNYRRGADSWVQEITILVGRGSERSAWQLLHDFVAGSGPRSVKARLDSSPAAPYTSCDTVHVTNVTLGSVRVSEVDYLGATFSVSVTGPGTT